MGRWISRLNKGTRQSGFSLVELMIVVAIIGILATLAVPRFQSFQAKARQSEAKNNLSHIFTLQQSFFGDNDRFGRVDAGRNSCPSANLGTDDIGFRVSPCTDPMKIRYTYVSSPNGNGFLGTATSFANTIVAGCATIDTWEINEDKRLRATADAVQLCN